MDVNDYLKQIKDKYGADQGGDNVSSLMNAISEKYGQTAPAAQQTSPVVPQTAPTLYTAESLLAGNAEVRERQAEIERLQQQLAAIPAGKEYDAERQLAQYDLSNAQAALTDINTRAEKKAASMQEDYAKWYAEDQKNVPYYNSIPQAKDFAANSVDIAKQTGRTTIEGEVASRMGNGMARFAPGQVIALLRERGATEDEIKTFVYIYNTKGWKEAEAYYQHILPAMNERAAQENYAKARAFADQHEVLATAASVPQNLGGGVAGALDLTYQNARRALTGRPVDYNTPNLQMANYANEMRGQVAENIQTGVTEGTGSEFAGKAASFLYNTGNSMLDSASVMGLTVAGLPNAAYLLGTSAGVNATQEAHNRGATDGQAFAAGVLAGIAEEFFEEYSIEKFFSLKKPNGFSDLAKNVIKQAIPEASEEVATSLANALSEAIILRDKSSFNDSVRKYMEDGLPENEARSRALKDFAVSLGLDALGGFLSGGVFGAAGGAGQTMGQIRQGADVRREGQTTNLVNSALGMTGTESARMAEQMDNASDLAVGRLAQQMQDDSIRAAEIMLKQSRGESLTADEQAFITPFQKTANQTAQTAPVAQQTATNQTTEQQTSQPITTQATETQNAPAETANTTSEENASPAASETVERTPAQQEYDNAVNAAARRSIEIDRARKGDSSEITDDDVGRLRGNSTRFASEEEFNMPADQRNNLNPTIKAFADAGFKFRYDDFSKTQPRERWGNIAYFDTKTGEIVLNKALTVNPKSEGSARQLRKIVLHEVGHALRQTKAYDGMVDLIKGRYAGDGAYNDAVNQVIEDRRANLEDLAFDEAQEELVVEETAKLLSNSRNVARLVKDNRTLAQRIYDGIHDFLSRIGNRNDPELRDIRRAERLLRQGLQERDAQKKFSRSVNQQMLEDQTGRKNEGRQRYYSGDTIDSKDLGVRGERKNMPQGAREWSIFNRSLANKTSGMKDGEIRHIAINTADHVYLVETDGYMSGYVDYKISLNEDIQAALEMRRKYCNEIDGSAETFDSWSQAVRSFGGRSGIDIRSYGHGGETNQTDKLSVEAQGSIAAGNYERSTNDSQTVTQKISSAKTSIKQIPALFKNPNVKFGKTNVDIGGGRFDLATDYLAENGTKNLVFDPYNRTEEVNTATLDYLRSGKRADTATCANVLNVIKEPAARQNVILETAKAIKPDGMAYFMVYEGDGSGNGKETSSGWQNNRKTADYVSEISEYFDDVQRKGKLIIAKDPIPNLPKASWEVSPGKGVKFSGDTISSEAEYDRLAKNPEKNRDALEGMVRQAAEAAMPNSKIRDEDGNLRVVYHGTDAEFTVFDRTKGRANMDIQGSFFSPWELDSEGYGSRVGRYYLDITNPASEGVAYKALNRFKGQNNAGVKAREYLESLGYDGVNNGDEEYIAFRSEQIKSADPVTYDNSGNIIPLQDRFDPSKPDIRWSSDTITDAILADMREEADREAEAQAERVSSAVEGAYDTAKELAAAQKEIARLSERLAYWRQQTRLTKTPSINEKAVAKQARAWLKEYGATDQGLAGAVTDLYNDLLRGEITFSEAHERATDIAKDMVDSIVAKDTPGEESRMVSPFDNDVEGAEAVAADLANEILERFYEIPQVRTAADRLMQRQAVRTAGIVNRMQERSEAQIERLEQKQAEALAKMQERNQKKIERLLQKQADMVAHNKEMQERARTRRQESEVTQRLLKIARRLHSMKTAPEFRSAIDEIIGEYDLVSAGMRENGYTRSDGVIVNGRVELTQMLDDYIERSKTDPDFIDDPSIRDRLERVNKKHFADLSLDEKIDMTEALLQLEHQIRTYNKEVGVAKARSLRELSQNAIREVRESKGINPASKTLGIKNLYGIKSLRPETFFAQMGGYKNGTIASLYQQLEDGQTKTLDFTMKATTPFDEFTKKHKREVAKWSGKNCDVITLRDLEGNPVTGPSGRPLQINPSMRIALYLHSLNNQNMAHIASGGITIPDMRLYKMGRTSEAYAHGQTVKLLPSQIDAITSQMTAAEREFAELTHNYFNIVSKQALNDTSLALRGYEVAQVENYFPIKSDSDFLASNFESLVRDGTLEGMGFLKERKNAKNPIMLEAVDSVLTRQIGDTAKYVGMAIPIRNFTGGDGQKGAYNWITDEGTLTKAVGDTWGSEAKSYIEKLMTDLQNTKQNGSQLMNAIRGNYAAAVLNFNPAVALGQFASYPTAADTLGWEALAKGLTMGRADIDLIAKYTPLLWYRSKGYVDTELGNIKNYGGRVAQAMTKLPGAKWIQKVDLFTIRRIWNAAEAWVQLNTDLEKGTDEYYRKTAEMFNKAVYQTQPNYTTLQRPQILRSDSEIERNLFMFATQRMQNYNMMYQSLGEMAEAKRNGNREAFGKLAGKAASTAATLLIANAVYTAMRNAVRRGIHKDDDEWVNEEGQITLLNGLMHGFVKNMAGSVVLGSEAADFVAALSKGKYYDTFSIPSIETINSLLRTSNSFMEETTNLISSGYPLLYLNQNPKFFKYAKDLAFGLAQMFGAPVENYEKYILGVMKWFSPHIAKRWENLTVKPTKKDVYDANTSAEEKAAFNAYMVEATGKANSGLYDMWMNASPDVSEKYFPPQMANKFTVDGEEHKLDPKQYAEADAIYEKTVGDNLSYVVSNVRRSNEEIQVKALNTLYSYAEAKAKASAVDSFELSRWMVCIDDCIKAGIPLSAACAYRAEGEYKIDHRDKTNKKVGAKETAENYIESIRPKLTQKQKRALFSVLSEATNPYEEEQG